MSGTVVLSKILDIRMKEKKEAQIAYYQSVDVFEEKATKLYKLLKEKETIEESLELPTGSSMKIDFFQDQLLYIDKLEKEILEFQIEVQQARNNMELKQNHLSDAHVETKKFEKLIEIRKNEMDHKARKTEGIIMDNVSIQQYLKFSK